MNPSTHRAALDAALTIEEKLLRPTAGVRDVTVDRRGRIRTWAHGSTPAQRRPEIIGSYDARANADMIAEDLLAMPAFVEAHA